MATKRRGSMRLARIRGIDLNLHVSLLFLLAYVVIVAFAQFPFVVSRAGIDPAALGGNAFGWALALAVGIFASVALHELGHAFVAQAMGIRVRGITLMMLGGVSEMERMPEKSYSEFKLAIVGPLVSLALAGVLQLVAISADSPAVRFYSYWLGQVNLVLAVFNLIPAFPLDGGRALRSVLAARMGLVNGTRLSVRISQLLAWAFGLVGVFSLNILLVFIAFFIYSTAQNEFTMILATRALRGMLVGEIAHRLVPIDVNLTLQGAASEMITIGSNLIPVTMGEGKVGLLTLDGIRGVPRREWASRPVSDIVEEVSRAVDASEPVSRILQELAVSPQHALPVQSGGTIIGIVRLSDLNELVALKGLENEVGAGASGESQGEEKRRGPEAA